MNNADWWANKLAQTQPQAPVGRSADLPSMPPSQQPMQVMPTFQPQQAVSKAQSLNQTSSCPECGSGNYMAPTPQIALRCYDCGYPVAQSGSRYGALTGAKVDGPAKSAVGNNPANNWNPITSANQAIGRL